MVQLCLVPNEQSYCRCSPTPSTTFYLWHVPHFNLHLALSGDDKSRWAVLNSIYIVFIREVASHLRDVKLAKSSTISREFTPVTQVKNTIQWVIADPIRTYQPLLKSVVYLQGCGALVDTTLEVSPFRARLLRMDLITDETWNMKAESTNFSDILSSYGGHT